MPRYSASSTELPLAVNTPSTSAGASPASSSASRIISTSSWRTLLRSSPSGDAASATPTIAAWPRSPRSPRTIPAKNLPPRQPEHAFRDDVALDLIGARVDRVRAAGDLVDRPAPALDRVGR